jgi:hypothetical protein
MAGLVTVHTQAVEVALALDLRQTLHMFLLAVQDCVQPLLVSAFFTLVVVAVRGLVVRVDLVALAVEELEVRQMALLELLELPILVAAVAVVLIQTLLEAQEVLAS